jgi:hypothetical protein
VTIPAAGCVLLSRQAGQYLQVANLSTSLDTSQTLPIALSFSKANGERFLIGSQSQPLRVPFSVPESPQPRPSGAAGKE